MRLLSAALKRLSRRDPAAAQRGAGPRGHRPGSPRLTRSPEAPLPAQHVQFYEAAICLLVYFSLILSGLGCEIPRLLRGGQAARQRGEWTGKRNVPGQALPPGRGGGGGTHGPDTAGPGSAGTCPTAGTAGAALQPGREGRWCELRGRGRRGGGETAETWPRLLLLGLDAFLPRRPARRPPHAAGAPRSWRSSGRQGPRPPAGQRCRGRRQCCDVPAQGPG